MVLLSNQTFIADISLPVWRELQCDSNDQGRVIALDSGWDINSGESYLEYKDDHDSSYGIQEDYLAK
jgi:hypothetical protein